MKILINFLLLLLACFQSLQAQENDTLPPPIDFKEYVAIMTPKTCDSIYRVDTLYYPFEGDVQMIELNFKSLWKRNDCHYDKNPHKKKIYFEDNLNSIFIFRNRNNKIKSVYNNDINIIIDLNLFKDVTFSNKPKYQHNYIIINKSRLIKTFLDSDRSNYITFVYRDAHQRKGLGNLQGDIVLPAVNSDIFLYKEENSILTTLTLDHHYQTANYHFYNYDNLELINTYLNVYTEKHEWTNDFPFPYFVLYKLKDNISKGNYSNGQGHLVNKRGDDVLLNTASRIIYTPKYTIVYNRGSRYGLLNEKLEYILKPIYDHISLYTKDNNDYYVHVKLKNQQGIININKEIIIPIEYDSIIVKTDFMKKDYVFLVRKHNLWGLYDKDFKMLIPMIYSNIDIGINHVLVSDKEGNIGIYDSDYNLLHEPVFKSAERSADCVILRTYHREGIVFHEAEIYEAYVLYGLYHNKLKLKKLDSPFVSYSHIDKNGNIVLKGSNRKLTPNYEAIYFDSKTIILTP